MRIEYFVPPAAQRRGGIDLAIGGMRRALGDRHEITLAESGAPRNETELVHFHGLWQRNHLAAQRASWRRNLPYLVSPHGMLEPWAYRQRKWKKWPWLKLFGQRQFDRSRAVLATSQMEATNLTRFARSIKIAPLGLDEQVSVTREEARDQLRVTTGTKIVLYLSRIDRKKGLDLLIRAMKDHEDYQLWVVGDGDPAFTSDLKRISNERVHWTGPAWGSERWKYLLAADVFCLPTHSENFGFAILEALWVGTPVITTTQTPWIEHRDVEGLHICDDNLDSLRSTLGEVLPRPSRPDSLRRWARENFHWDRLADTYDQIYRESVSP